MITVPESVRFYRADAVNRAALDVLMESKRVPGDLTLPEAERYELAVLAAQRVRVEHWTMLRALWGATWAEAVRINLPGARLLSYGEHRDFASETEEHAVPSVEAAWDDKGICGVFVVPEAGHLFTALQLTEEATEVQLQFYLIDGEGYCETSDELALGPDWGEDDENRRQTLIGRLPLMMSDAGIDAVPMAKFADAAMAALAGAIA